MSHALFRLRGIFLTILTLNLLVSCGKPSSSHSSGNYGFEGADLDLIVGNWATDSAFVSISRTQGEAGNLVMELTFLDLEKLTVISKRFYHLLNQPVGQSGEAFGIDEEKGILKGNVTSLENGIRIEEKTLADGMNSLPVEISEWVFNEDFSQLSLSWQIGSEASLQFQKVATEESQFLYDLDIQVSRKVKIAPPYDELFEGFLGSWKGKPTQSWPTGTRVDVIFEPTPSGRILLERWSFTHPSGEILLENTNYTLFDRLFEKNFERPFGLVNSAGMVGYWQVNQSGELMQFEGSDARITRELIGDDQFLGTWHLKSEAGIWRNGYYNIEMQRVGQ